MFKISTLLILGVVLSAAAQDKILEFELEQDHDFLNYRVDGSGAWFVTAKEKSGETHAKVFRYDGAFNQKFVKSFTSGHKKLSVMAGGGINQRRINYPISGTNQFLVAWSDHIIFDEEGNIRSYPYINNKRVDEDAGGLDVIVKILVPNYTCYIGTDPKQKVKRGKEPDLYLYRRSHSDLSTEKILVAEPEVESSTENLEWLFHSAYNERFFLVSKEINKEKTIDIYNIVGYNYDGKIVSTLKIPIQLEKKFFAAANTGFGNTKVRTFNGSSSHHMDESGVGNIEIDIEKGYYYIYGLYTNKRDKDFYNANFAGFYIHKYTDKGELLWKQQRAIEDKSDFNERAVAFYTRVDFFWLPEDKIGLGISKTNTKHYAHAFLMDRTDGNVISTKKFKFSVNQTKLDGIKGGAFSTGYMLKEFGKDNFDLWTLYGSYFNPKLEKFLKTTSSDNNYDSTFTSEGIVVLEEDVKTNSFRLMKFNW